MKQCKWCGKDFYANPKQSAKKFCTPECNNKAQWDKRKYGLHNPKPKKSFVATEFFDWREYPNTILV